MPTFANIPILISQYADALFVAKGVLVNDDELPGTSAREAFRRIERHLKKQAARGRFWSPLAIDDATYLEHTVGVRVAERGDDKMIQFGAKIKLRVRCVLAVGDMNEIWCVLPDWDIAFACEDRNSAKPQAVELVKQQFANLPTDKLRQRLLPMASELRMVRVRVEDARAGDGEDHAPLDLVAEPISLRVRKSSTQTAWHREDEVEWLMREFGETSSVLLVGDAGCGKSTILQTAAIKHQDAMRQKHLELGETTGAPPLIWRTTASNLIAGMQYLGQWEERLEQVIAKLAEMNAILCVDSLVELVRLGGRSPEDSIAAFMLPYLRRNELRLIAESTHESLDACRRLLAGFAESFRILPVDRLDAEQTEDIAQRILNEAKRNHRIESEDSAAASVVSLYRRYLPYQAPPQGPVRLLGRLVGEVRKSKQTNIKTSQVFEKFTAETGLPRHLIEDSERLDPSKLKQHFDREVIGQPHATEVAVDTVVKLKSGMVDPKRPVATMLFCGPTGVGKTQLARSLADYVLAGRSDGGRLLRLDMSEYQSWGAVDRLLMTPDGEPAVWIQRLRTWPLGVLLFDEFEKAAPEVFDCLLSALDEGRISDRFGRTTTLCGTIIVMTSNVGASRSTTAGFVRDDSRKYGRALEQHFRPEFLNRLDSITTFRPLDRDTVRQIVEKELAAINQRPAMQERGLKLHWPVALVERLADVGFDPALGARPLQRAIEKEVVAPLAKWLLANDPALAEISWSEISVGHER